MGVYKKIAGASNVLFRAEQLVGSVYQFGFMILARLLACLVVVAIQQKDHRHAFPFLSLILMYIQTFLFATNFFRSHAQLNVD